LTLFVSSRLQLMQPPKFIPPTKAGAGRDATKLLLARRGMFPGDVWLHSGNNQQLLSSFFPSKGLDACFRQHYIPRPLREALVTSPCLFMQERGALVKDGHYSQTTWIAMVFTSFRLRRFLAVLYFSILWYKSRFSILSSLHFDNLSNFTCPNPSLPDLHLPSLD